MGMASSDASLAIDEALCLNLRGRSPSCNACANACASHALELSEDAVKLNADKCTGCGACLPSCPASVFRLSSFSPRRFVQALAGKEEAHIHCSASTDGGGGVVIPCHLVADARLMAAAFAVGTKTFHIHGLAQCQHCDKGDAVEHVNQTQAQLERWFGAEAAPRIAMEVLPSERGEAGHGAAHRPQMSRREFFRLASRRAVASASQWLVPVEEDDEREAQESFYHGDLEFQRPAVYQALLAEHVAELPWVAGQVPWRSPSLDEKCNVCLACGRRCPTGALHAVETATERRINRDTALCTGCGLCVRVCPMDAVTVPAVKDAVEVLMPRSVVMHRDHGICDRCGQTFVPQTVGESLCAVCKNEQELKKQWLGTLEQ